MNWLHFGLYFTPDHVAFAQKQHAQPPFDAAWTMLHERAQTGIQAAQWAGFCYRFSGDEEGGEDGIEHLMAFSRRGFDEETTFASAIQETLILAQAFEMLRDHPAMTSGQHSLFLELLLQRITYLSGLDYTPSYVETLLLALLHLAGGIVLEQESMLQYAVNVYEQTIREDIHPQGYMPKAVQPKDGGGLYRQYVAVQTLVLTAEAAGHVGIPLWDYSFRGVSVMTALTYLLYYYYFPEKWRWDAQVTNEPFQIFGGGLEMVNRRTDLKDLRAILDDLRPIYDAPGGGLTTLSHGSVVKRKGLLGR